MKTFLVNIPLIEHNGAQVYICGELEAEDWDHAETVAEEKGYDLLGELQDTLECSAQVEAMIQKQYSEVH